jgi:quercetin dioxygenase-like cupin family protein
MEFGPDGQDWCEAQADDFIHVPRGAVHREINPGDTENILLIIRVGSGEPVFNVEGPAR